MHTYPLSPAGRGLGGGGSSTRHLVQSPPCMSVLPVSSHRMGIGEAGGSSKPPGAKKPVGELDTPPAAPGNPNSRSVTRPHLQGRAMEQRTVIGIDVSKDRLDIAILPSQESFAVARDSGGLDALVQRVKALAPERIVLEATGG